MSKSAIILCAWGIDETQREQIQEFVRKHSVEWWHQQPDVWIFISTNKRTFFYEPMNVICHSSSTKYILLDIDHAKGWSTRGYAPWFRESFDEALKEEPGA